jgi:hypothetical protein
MVLVEKLTVAQLVTKFVFTEPEGSHSDRDGALMMETVSTSETSANFNVTTRRYIPEDFTEPSFSPFNIYHTVKICQRVYRMKIQSFSFSPTINIVSCKLHDFVRPKTL